MERLTKNLSGMVWFASQDADLWIEPYEMSTHDIRTAIKKLSAYEDTGFTPEEVAAFPYRKEFAYADYMKELFPKMERAEELSAADKEGRIIIPPCKLGDTVWVLHTGFNTNFLHVYQGRCVEISQSLFHGATVEIYTIDVYEFTVDFYGHDIGSTLFFSEAEAEAALKKRKEEKHGPTDE